MPPTTTISAGSSRASSVAVAAGSSRAPDSSSGVDVATAIEAARAGPLRAALVDQARAQLARTPGPLPRLEIVRKAASIDAYDYEDFVIHDYAAQPHIKAPVAV